MKTDLRDVACILYGNELKIQLNKQNSFCTLNKFIDKEMDTFKKIEMSFI